MADINNHDLDKIDRKILALIETDARMPITELARKTGTSRTVVEYRLKQFEKHGIIRGFYTLLDPSKFGLTVWKLWISLRSDDHGAFFSYIEKNPRVWWYSECAGIYDSVICVLARSPHEFNSFFNKLQENFASLITDSAILINVSFEYHSRGYLLDSPSRLLKTSFQNNPVMKKISEDAVHILGLLSKDSRISYVDISRKTGRNVKTIKRSIRELRESGIIVYFRPSIDVSLFGYEYYKVLLYLHNPRGGILPSMVHWCRQQKNIMAVISCVGPWQLELEVEVDTFRNLCNIIAELKDNFPDVIKNYETLLVTREGNFDLDLIDKVLQMKKTAKTI